MTYTVIDKPITYMLLAGCLLASTLNVQSASAATIVNKSLGSFGSPVEWRMHCDRWIKPWPGAKICVAHTYQNLQHGFSLVVKGPSPDKAATKVLSEALAVAATAAIGAGIMTPSPEPTLRMAAALSAAKTAFVSYLSARGLEQLISQYDVTLEHKTHWQ